MSLGRAGLAAATPVPAGATAGDPAPVGLLGLGDHRRDGELCRLFREHYPSLRKLAFCIIGDDFLAEEVVMEALASTLKTWDRIRDPGKALFYLRRAVVNLSRSTVRRRLLERRVYGSLSSRDAVPPLGWDPDIHETKRDLWHAVRALPPRQRACIVLRHVHELDQSEIARFLGCSEATVRSQLSRARLKLRIHLTDHAGLPKEGVNRPVGRKRRAASP